MRMRNESMRGASQLRWPLALGLPVVAIVLSVVPALAAAGGQASLSSARAATAAFHDLCAPPRTWPGSLASTPLAWAQWASTT